MKTNRKNLRNNAGSILVLVMVVLLAFSLLTVSLLQLGRDSTVQAIQEQRNAQAHWIAEAGLEKELARIYADRAYRDGLFPGISLDEDFAEGHYTVTILSKTDNPTTEETTFEIESKGTVSNAAISATAAVRVELTGAPGVHQALLALGGTSYVKQSQSGGIYGDVYIAGEGDVNRLVDGNLEDADDGTDVSYGGTTLPVDILNFPHLNQTPYNNWLATASSTTDTNVFQGTYNGPFNLAAAPSNTIYVNGNVNIKDNVTGSGTIVASGSVIFDTNNKTLASGVRIVSGGNINIDKSGITFGENDELFSKHDILIGGNLNFPYPGLSILAMNDVEVLANVTGFKGIIYAEGRVRLVNGVQTIEGTIIAWEGFDVLSNATIIYNPEVFADPNPIDFGDGFVRTEKLQWEENPYNGP
jgi:hypothetical protein